MGKRGKSKKALSPAIATVLLIVLVLVLAIIIFLWARSFISEQVEKFGSPIKNSCEDVNFDIELTQVSPGVYKIEIVNKANVPIQSFEIKEIQSGNSETSNWDVSADVGSSASETYSLKNPSAEKIIIYPALLGSVKGKSINKVYTCLEYGKTITL